MTSTTRYITTQHGNKLEVIEDPSDFKNTLKYTFVLHEPRECGENITILLVANLASPDFFMSKFLREF